MIIRKKTYTTPFDLFDPVILFEGTISDKGPKSIIITEKSYYSIDDLLSKIRDFLSKQNIRFTEHESFAYLGGNRYKMLQEKAFVSIESKLVVSIITDTATIKGDIDYYMSSDSLTLDDEKELNLLIEKCTAEKINAAIHIAHNSETEELFKTFVEEICSKEIKKSKKDNELGIIVNTEFGLELEVFEIKPTTLDLKTNYNDDFEDISDIIVGSLKDEAHGIILLHGVKGSGKTNYIRWLTKKIKSKRIIYVSPDMAADISSPQFISFFIKYPNSIIIIEDAENILKTRKAGGNQAVSNLLNLSDGLLGDALKLQIICTFNSEISEIDEAIRRPGRMIAEYKFEKLTKIKSQLLLDKLYPKQKLIAEKEMSLAEIYSINKKQFYKEDDRTIGFNNRKY